MANKRINMLEIKQIIQLKLKGVSNREISRRLFVNRKTVDEYVRHFKGLEASYEELSGYTESQLQEIFPRITKQPDKKTYEQLKDLLPNLEKESKAIGATTLELWKHYKQIYPDGYGYTQFKKYLNEWKQKPAISMHMQHKFGDKLFVDYAGKKLSIIDKQTGDIKKVEVFIAVLGASQYTYVEATYTQQQEDFINSLCNCLEYIQGVPQAIVPDNLKQAVDKSHKYEPRINKQLRCFACHYNTSILPTRAYKPQDKSLVEIGVRMAYQRIYFHLRNQSFFSLQELNEAIRKLLKANINGTNFQNRDYSRQLLFDQQEKDQLQPLPESRYQIRYFHKATVQKSYHIYFGKDKHYYSVPYQYVGKEVALQYNRALIEIYYDHQRIAVHRRNRKIGDYTTIDDHMPETHRYVKGWSMAYFIEWAETQDQRIHYFVKRLFENAPHPEHVYKSCAGLQSLKRRYGLKRLIKACQRAMEFDQYKYKIVESILKKGIDKQTEIPFSESDPSLPEHDNVRGKDYYQ